jgi:hypothetical protein
MAPRSGAGNGLSSRDPRKQLDALLTSLRWASGRVPEDDSDQSLRPCLIHDAVLTAALERNETSPEVRALAIDVLLHVPDLPQTAGFRFAVCIQAELHDRHHPASLLAALRALPALARPLLMRIVRSSTFEDDAKACLVHANPIVRQAAVRSFASALLHAHLACFGPLAFEEVVCDTAAERAGLVEDTMDKIALVWRRIADRCLDLDDLVAAQAFAALATVLDERTRAAIARTSRSFGKHIWSTPPTYLPCTGTSLNTASDLITSGWGLAPFVLIELPAALSALRLALMLTFRSCWLVRLYSFNPSLGNRSAC